MKQTRIQKTRTTQRSTTERNRPGTPATDRREIRKDIARVWWPES
jgi:hypothetical protein